MDKNFCAIKAKYINQKYVDIAEKMGEVVKSLGISGIYIYMGGIKEDVGPAVSLLTELTKPGIDVALSFLKTFCANVGKFLNKNEAMVNVCSTLAVPIINATIGIMSGKLPAIQTRIIRRYCNAAWKSAIKSSGFFSYICGCWMINYKFRDNEKALVKSIAKTISECCEKITC